VVDSEASFEERILKHFVNPDHPVCAAAVASHLFLTGAATPPVSGGNCQSDIHSFIDCIYRCFFMRGKCAKRWMDSNLFSKICPRLLKRDVAVLFRRVRVSLGIKHSQSSD
jgi:hypothetical protein